MDGTLSKEASTFRLPALDGLRAIAILLVLLHHITSYLSEDLGYLKGLLGTGWNGVYLFFVLSGYLIGTLAFREIAETGNLRVGHFWGRRFFRTWPLYLVVLATNALHARSIEPSLWHYLTFTQNFFSPKFFMQSWSLAVEEQFYFLFPIAVTFVIWAKRRWVGALVFALFYAVPFYYRYRWGTGFYPFLSTFSVMDSLLTGIGIAYATRHYPGLLRPFIRFPNLTFLVGMVFVYHWLAHSISVNFLFGGQAVGFGLILLSAMSERLWCSRLLSTRIAHRIALYSYSIYLTHDHVLYAGGRLSQSLGLGAWPQLLFLILCVGAGSAVVGGVSYHLVERPVLALRDLLFPRDASAPSALPRLRDRLRRAIIRPRPDGIM